MDEPVPSEKMKILVVDDTQANVNVLSEKLGKQGYEIFVTLSGEMALKILKKAKTDQEDIVKGFNLGAIDYVTKQFQHQELLA